MHFVFMPYGIKNFVDFVIEDFNHKYLPLKIYKEGEKDKFVLIQVQIRVLPFGLYELVFPKEFLSEILSALKVKSENQQNKYVKRLNKSIMGFKPLSLMRKALKLEPIPGYKEIPHPNFPVPEYKKYVPIIPIGIREDKEIIEKQGEFKGWSHEGI